MRFCSSTSGLLKLVAETPRFWSSRIYESTRDLRGQATKNIAWRGYEYPLNPFAPGDFAEKRVWKLVEWFSGHCRAIKS